MKRIWSLIVASMMILSLALTGCSQQPAEDASKDEFKSQIFFKGSSTLAPVVSQIATEFIDANETWNKVNADFPEKSIDLFVSAGGSSAGVKAIIDGTSDFGMVSREVKDEEKEKIADYKEFRLGLDVLTISVNPENPILDVKKNLTTEEVMKIFSGEYKYWDEVAPGLPHNEIVVVTRDIGGGAHQVFQDKVMGDAQVKAEAIQEPSMGALVTKIMENKDAIGYASYGFVNQNVGKITPLEVDGIAPTEGNIISGAYKISRPLIVIKSGELLPQEQLFVDLMLSEEGMKTVEKMGYVPAK
ncbi:phosphate ABC transporter substrate-binding p rotein, PhoT family [Peptoclostridium acidaminophilum DSM 3953]|uniref:Phosphate ABC transporter substrate-binding p rotein, PhoT family n=1 Tax=Peptoclostridium acidaminophilum DSM 3953 TaxID=1286171 RepID=W8T6Q6_PEPAC|nr:phosphate ABC transporter substrate-binding protein [Peptoclostridium acidaminophilum]AHM57429.1 phosphate ABC transporter substrate-binding p rotein, PhoT family [Peptoclostridium acidaminophilum DSM 3953]